MMMEPEYYIFTGGVIPRDVTHVIIANANALKFARAIMDHPNIEKVICHDGVEKMEDYTFYNCRSLRQVIMPGVKEVERRAYEQCRALIYVECGKLEIIGEYAFCTCESLNSIDLSSIRIVEGFVFSSCWNLISVKFGKDLVSIGESAFLNCRSLERITLPLKDGHD